MAGMLESVEHMLLQEQLEKYILELYIGEIYSLRAYDKYLLHVDIEEWLEIYEKSIQIFENRNPYAYGLAWIFYGASM